MALSFFDCNVSIGSPPTGVFRPFQTADELLQELEWHGVDQALVYHSLMSCQSPVVGNAALSEAIAGRPQLHGTWAILPPQTGELPEGDSFFQQIKSAGIRALWAFPTEHRYLLRRKTFGQFLDAVSERRIPLLIPSTAGGPLPGDRWALLYDLLEEYPELTVIAAAHGPWGEDRYFRPLLESYERVYLDISRYELDGGLREVADRYGAERLLYGSSFPTWAMGGPRLMVAQADIGEDAKRAIAGGNLRRLLEEVQL